MGLVGPSGSGGIFTTFSAKTPKPVGVIAPEGFTIRVREPGREDREVDRLGGGPGGSDEKGPEGRRI